MSYLKSTLMLTWLVSGPTSLGAAFAQELPGPLALASIREARRLAVEAGPLARESSPLTTRNEPFTATSTGVTAAHSSDPDRRPRRDPWSQVKQLRAGADLRVELDDHASSRGIFLRADDELLVLVVAGQQEQLSRTHIRRVEMACGTLRRRNALIGLAVGAGTADAALRVRCGFGPSACLEVAPAYFYPLAGVGAVVGALQPAGTNWREIYDANDRF